jgi:thiol-disulfide isomerase/thioredoxin
VIGVRRGAIALVSLLLTATVLTGCSEDSRFVPSPPDVKVDTPEMKAVKAEIGMADCVPGAATEAVDGGLPEVTLECLGGGPAVDLSSLRGPLVINLWQAFCEPCKIEMPVLQEFHETYGDRVGVLGIDFNDVKPAAALELARETGAKYPSLADPGGVLMTERAFAIGRRGMPAFVFLHEDGTLAVGPGGEPGVSGGVDSLAELVADVDAFLGIDLTQPASDAPGTESP